MIGRVDIEIAQNIDVGDSQTPSMVYYGLKKDGTQMQLIGQPAKLKQGSNFFKNVLYDAKRILGRDFDDAKLQEYMKSWPFTLVADSKNNKAIYQCTLKHKKKEIVEEIRPE